MENRKLNIVRFVSVDGMMKLVSQLGIERVLTELAARIEGDFRRWEWKSACNESPCQAVIGVQ